MAPRKTTSTRKATGKKGAGKKAPRKKGRVKAGPGQGTAPKIWRPAFLRALENSGNVTLAHREARVSRATVYKARKANPDFAQAWDEALETASDLLEAEARRRGVAGVPEPILYKGQLVFHEGKQVVMRRYSDGLLQTLLRANRPGKFREPRWGEGGQVPPDGPGPAATRFPTTAGLCPLGGQERR